MKKLKCHDYLAQANTREKLCIYTQHLFTAHSRNLPNAVMTVRLATSNSFNTRAYEEVDFLARQVEKNYAKSGEKGE